MKQSDIQVGKTYKSKTGRYLRIVIDVGFILGSSRQVRYRHIGLNGSTVMNLSSFARWAGSVVEEGSL